VVKHCTKLPQDAVDPAPMKGDVQKLDGLDDLQRSLPTSVILWEIQISAKCYINNNFNYPDCINHQENPGSTKTPAQCPEAAKISRKTMMVIINLDFTFLISQSPGNLQW